MTSEAEPGVRVDATVRKAAASDAGTVAGGLPVAERAFPRARTGRTGWGKVRDLAVVLFAFVAGAALLGAYATYRIWEVGRRDDRRPADAIVVLGAAQYNGRPSPVLAARLDHAIDLYKEGLAPYFVVTGGKLPGDRVTEAVSERDYAVSHGVPASAILMETTGRTTLESLQNVQALFTRHGLHTALFVSDRTHMLRVLKMAQDQGIEGFASPTATSPADATPSLRMDSTMHELGGLALYFFVEQPHARAAAPPPASVGSAPPGGAVRQAGRSAQLYYRTHVLKCGQAAGRESAFFAPGKNGRPRPTDGVTNHG